MSAPPSPPTPPALFSRRNIPNILTMSRVALAIAFFGVLTPWNFHHSPLSKGNWPDPWLLLAAAIFIVAALTDALDGHLARKWNVVSVFGRIMDPFADKVLVIGAFVYLAGPGFASGDHSVSGVHPWMVAVIVARELLVTSIRAAFESKGVSFAASWSGKWKMILQSVCVPVVLLLPNFTVPFPSPIWPQVIIVYATVVVTAWSAIPYIQRALRTPSSPPPSETNTQ